MADNLVEALDRPAAQARNSAGAVLWVLGAGLCSAALFGADPVHAWAQRLPASMVSAHVLWATETWQGMMQDLGTAQWHGRARALFQAAKNTKFGAAAE